MEWRCIVVQITQDAMRLGASPSLSWNLPQLIPLKWPDVKKRNIVSKLRLNSLLRKSHFYPIKDQFTPGRDKRLV